jgi:hypothetical protein
VAGPVGVKTLFIEPGSPWENGYIESFNGKLSDELLACEMFDTLLEAKVLIERWRRAYNAVRPHSSLGYRPPAPEAIVPWTSAFGVSLLPGGDQGGEDEVHPQSPSAKQQSVVQVLERRLEGDRSAQRWDSDGPPVRGVPTGKMTTRR